MPSLVICTPSTGCSSSSSSEYSFDLRNIVPSDSRHRKTRHTGINRRKKDLQFLLSIRVVAGALLRSGSATSKRSAAASSRLVRCPRSDTAGEKRSKSRADTVDIAASSAPPTAAAPSLIVISAATLIHSLRRQRGRPLLVEPEVFEARAVVDAVDHADQTLDVWPAAGDAADV